MLPGCLPDCRQVTLLLMIESDRPGCVQLLADWRGSIHARHALPLSLASEWMLYCPNPTSGYVLQAMQSAMDAKAFAAVSESIAQMLLLKEVLCSSGLRDSSSAACDTPHGSEASHQRTPGMTRAPS